jgi:hypothetical protein
MRALRLFMKLVHLSRYLLLLGFASIATSLPEKLVRADSDASSNADAGRSDAGAIADAAGSSDASSGRYETKNGTVYDKSTKLTWQLDVSATPLGWAAARDYCHELDLADGGWRLPSVNELQTLIDESSNDPAIDLTAFPGTPSDYFWTSSVLPHFESFVWTVYFGYGLSTFFDVNQNHLVRCVR